MKTVSSRLLLSVALVALPAMAGAHRQWMVPSTTVVAGTNDYVTVDAAVSNDLFYADHQPMRLNGVKVWAPDGSASTIENGSTGRYRSVFDVKLDKPGTWKIGTQSTSVGGTFKVNGEERRVGGFRGGGMRPQGAGAPGTAPGRGGQPGEGSGQREGMPQGGPGGPGGPGGRPMMPSVASVADIPADATDVKLTETSSRYELFVTAGEPTKTVFQPTSKGLEMQPITHPDELVQGEPAQFRFLVDGKPAPNLKVTVIPGGKRYRDAEGARELTTGSDGVLKVDWPAAGMYWLNTTTSDNHPSEARATDRRMSYSATLEVMAP